MKIAKDTVVSLRYELVDAEGELLEKTEEPVNCGNNQALLGK